MSAYFLVFFFQAEDGIRDLVRSRGLGDVYKRQVGTQSVSCGVCIEVCPLGEGRDATVQALLDRCWGCLLYTSDAADERSSVDLGGRRTIKKKTQ